MERQPWSAQGKVIRAGVKRNTAAAFNAKASARRFTPERAVTLGPQHCCDTSDLLTVKPGGAVTGTRAAGAAEPAASWCGEGPDEKRKEEKELMSTQRIPPACLKPKGVKCRGGDFSVLLLLHLLKFKLYFIVKYATFSMDETTVLRTHGAHTQ